jgi:hypothetical protein
VIRLKGRDTGHSIVGGPGVALRAVPEAANWSAGGCMGLWRQMSLGIRPWASPAAATTAEDLQAQTAHHATMAVDARATGALGPA